MAESELAEVCRTRPETGQYQDDDLAEMRTRDGRKLYAQARLSYIDGYRMSFYQRPHRTKAG